MVEPINFLVVNANDWYNKGDVTNRLGLILSLRRAFSGYPIRIFIESLTPKEDQNYFGQFPEVTVFGSMFSSGENKSVSKLIAKSIVGLLAFLILFSFYSVAYVLKRDALKKSAYTMKHVTDDSLFNQVRTFTVLLFSSDVVISSPGGFLHDDYPMILLVNLFPLLLVLMLKKPLIIYNQSIGPFKSKIMFKITKLIVCKARVIALRELYSLGENKLNCKYLLAADSTFSIRGYILKKLKHIDSELGKEIRDILNQLERLKAEENVIIGLTLVGYFLQYKDPQKMRNYLNFLGKLLITINAKLKEKNKKCHFVILPQNTNRYELKLIKDIERFLRITYKINNISFVPRDFPPEGMFALLNNVDLLIASRMHSAIFASLLAKPFVMISYQPKFEGIARMLRLQDYVFDIFSLNEEQLSKLSDIVVTLLFDQENVRKLIEKRVIMLERKSLTTSKYIRSILLRKYLH